MESVVIFQNKIKNSEKSGIFKDNFANLFSVWLNRRQSDFHICSCIQSAEILHIMESLENSTVHS